MASSKGAGTSPLIVAGAPLAEALSRQVGGLTRRIVDRLVAEVPFYRLLPTEEMAGDVTRIVDENVRILARVLGAGRPATADELAGPAASAALRAEEGVPLEAVLAAYHVGITSIWEELVGAAAPTDLADVLTATRLLLRHLQDVAAAISAAYVRERQTMINQEHSARHALLSALLEGSPPELAAGRAGVALPTRYVVLRLALGPHPDESAPGPGAAIAARRKLRRLQGVLDHAARGPVLSMLDAAGGVVLLPLADPVSALGAVEWERVRAVVDRMAHVAGAVHAAAEFAEPVTVPAAAEQAGEVLAVVQRCGYPPGVYRLSDVLVEYQLSRPGEARAQLAALLRPLEEHPQFLLTLQTYVEHQLDRRRTAARLHIHPNTVDYRLHRVHGLTGLDPARPADLHRLSAALIARNAQQEIR